MCGLLFYLCSCEFDCSEIVNRGPDSFKTVTIFQSITFVGCVLHHQGLSITSQPIINNDSVFLWNGENYDNEFGNDGENLLIDINAASTIDALTFISNVNGPYSILYYNKKSELIFFGRDFLGRRSLLCGLNKIGEIVVISSVITDGCVHIAKWIELPAVGLYTAHLSNKGHISDVYLHVYAFYSLKYAVEELYKVGLSNIIVADHVIGTTNNLTKTEIIAADEISSLLSVLELSIKRRVNNVHGQCVDCLLVSGFKPDNNCTHSKVAILFSGGLDSAVVAALTDKFVDVNDSIDLLNVAFYTASDDKIESADRISGLACLEELAEINPNRKWNFVQIDVYPEELKRERNNRIAKLIQPCDSVLDDSIGCALWFAARGRGRLLSDDSEYVSPARVVLTGIGADELMAGYSRHRNIYNKLGYDGLADELRCELRRISSRNMGRDDRVLSSHGREGRFPFLDRDVVTFLESIPITVKCDLEKERGVGEKQILRLLARDRLQLRTASGNLKRAIQFGSRIAKVDKLAKGGKASEKCSRLELE